MLCLFTFKCPVKRDKKLGQSRKLLERDTKNNFRNRLKHGFNYEDWMQKRAIVFTIKTNNKTSQDIICKGKIY